jgi:DNA-binding winged helix-turn-helix (wHTH) protein
VTLTRVAFADCVFDTGRRELLKRGRPVHLSPKAFELLRALLERRPDAVAKAELRDRLWPDLAVGHTSLGRALVEVRAAVGDDARDARLIRTVHGFGYAFVGTATEVGAPDAGAVRSNFRLAWGQREIELPVGENVLGRAPGCALWIDAPGISRRHARVVVTDSGATIEDLGSKNGTYLGGRKIAGPVGLAHGDEICFGSVRAAGSVRMTVHVFQDAGSTRSEPSA